MKMLRRFGRSMRPDAKGWETLPLACNVLLIASDPRTGEELERVAAHNVIVSVGKTLAARILADEVGYDTGLKFLEVGTGSTPAALGDTGLQTGIARSAVSDPPLRTANVIQFRAFFAAASVTALIKEVGLFGHSTATATLGTGILFNRAIVTFNNVAGTKDLTVVVAITVG